jgi:hypothetical protein
VLSEQYVFETYQPFMPLTKALESLSSSEAKDVFKEFCAALPSRVEWWRTTTALAGIEWNPRSDEYAIAGWRLVKDGYADEIVLGRSGGMWIMLGYDWAIHTSEMLRDRYSLKWKLITGKGFLDYNYPALSGFQFAHQTYSLSLLHLVRTKYYQIDQDPPFPVRTLAGAHQDATQMKVDLDHLAELGLPDHPRSYLAGKPPFPDSPSRSNRNPRP